MTERHFPFPVGSKVTKVAIYVGLIVILALLPLFTESSYYLHILIITFIYVIATSSLRLMAISGQLNLGHAGFMSIGAYSSAILSKELGWTPWGTMLIGGLATMVIALLVGYPFTRLRAFYFVVVSLFFGVTILSIYAVFTDFTGGYYGYFNVPSLFASKVPSYYFFLALTSLSLFIIHRFEFCRLGITWKAIAQSYSVASSVGINESGQRVVALAVGCFFVGIAGAGYAHYNLGMSPHTFGFMGSINLIVYMLVGGIESFAGPIVGTVVLIIVPELFRALKEFLPFLYAAILIVVLFVMPKGLAGLPGQIRAWVTKLREKKAVTHAS